MYQLRKKILIFLALIQRCESAVPADAVAGLKLEVPLPPADELDAADPLAEGVLPGAAAVPHAHLDVGHDAGGAVVRVGGEGEVDGDDVDGAAQVDQEPRVGVVGGGCRTLEP